ncbi:hypothetical protein [Novosphingobium sp.]|uniref:hypothetical protein n=1 Tax=Novosphingobium sp. TaxID=1874826 RepID=UPI002FE26101
MACYTTPRRFRSIAQREPAATPFRSSKHQNAAFSYRKKIPLDKKTYFGDIKLCYWYDIGLATGQSSIHAQDALLKRTGFGA